MIKNGPGHVGPFRVIPPPPSFQGEFQNGCVSVHPGTGGCWIDGTVDTSLHDHHLIPQNAGGTNGPQARICSDCHNAIHHAAELEVTAEEYVKLRDCKKDWSKFGPATMARANFLIQVIMRSEAIAATSANKTTKVGMTLSAVENNKLEYLARRFGMSKTKVIRHLIMKE